MIAELENLLKSNSDCQACSDQVSLIFLLTDLRAVADFLDLDFTGAHCEAETIHLLCSQSLFCDGAGI